MLDYSTKPSLIVSAVVGENDDTTTDESAFFEIPLDDGMKEIEVSVLKSTTPAGAQRYHLHMKTKLKMIWGLLVMTMMTTSMTTQ